MFKNRKKKVSISSLGDNSETWKNPEAVAQACSVNKEFLKISYNIHENTCAGVFFNKVTDRSRCFHKYFAKPLRTPI